MAAEVGSVATDNRMEWMETQVRAVYNRMLLTYDKYKSLASGL